MDCTFLLSKERRIKKGNKEFEKWTGRRSGRLEEGLFRGMQPQRIQEFFEFLDTCLKNDHHSLSQLRLKGAENPQKFYEVTAIRNPACEDEIIVNIRDAPHIWQLEEEIRESEEKYRSLVEQSKDLIFVLVEEEIVFANSILYVIAEEQRRNGKMFWKEYLSRFVVKDDLSRVLDFFTKAAQQALNRNSSVEFKIKDKNGTIRDILLSMDTITYQGQKAQIGVARDITERKKLEHKTKEAEKLRALAQFTASLAHEIRNPLEGLTSAVQLLLRTLDVQGENSDLLHVIRITASEISSTISQIVSMIREPKYSFSSLDVRTLIGDAIRTITRSAEYDPQVRIVTRVKKEVQTVFGDEGMLHRALVNLLRNACQAIPGEGFVKIHVGHMQERSKRVVSLTVRDSGTGIPESLLPQLWEPFVATTKKRGMGLGLFITKRVIEDHGGSIAVVRTGPTGTAFRLTLPAEPHGD